MRYRAEVPLTLRLVSYLLDPDVVRRTIADAKGIIAGTNPLMRALVAPMLVEPKAARTAKQPLPV